MIENLVKFFENSLHQPKTNKTTDKIRSNKNNLASGFEMAPLC